MRAGNDGGGLFTPVDAGSITTGAEISTSAAWADYDLDGYPDVILTRKARMGESDGVNYGMYENAENELHHNNVRTARHTRRAPHAPRRRTCRSRGLHVQPRAVSSASPSSPQRRASRTAGHVRLTERVCARLTQ